MRTPALVVGLVFCLGALSGCGGGGTTSLAGGGNSGNNGSGTGGSNGTCSVISIGQGRSLNGFRPFTSSNLWNTDISTAQVDPNSSAIINFTGSSIRLHADFGSGQYAGSDITLRKCVHVLSTKKPAMEFAGWGKSF